MNNWTPIANPRAYKFEAPKIEKNYRPWYERITPYVFNDAAKKGSCLVETSGRHSDSLFARAMIATDVGRYATKTAGLFTLSIRSDLPVSFAETTADVLDKAAANYGKQLLIIVEGIETAEEPLLSILKKNLEVKSSPVVAVTFDRETAVNNMDEFFVAKKVFDGNNGAPVARNGYAEPIAIGDEPKFDNIRLPC